ncbi:MAG: aminotransferase class I/II-fold pyridoxal phosphate-dependent enzyme [Pseudomonadota bacterium]
MTQEEQRAVLEFARARGLWIISDEVYGRMTYEVDHAPSFLQIIEPDDRVIVCNTFSKNWSMTGWRIGWVVAPEALGQVYENLIQYNTSGVPTFLQFGAVAAINDGEPYVNKVVERCRVGRQMVTDAFDAIPRIRYAPPAGAFYAFFAVEGEEDSRKLAFKIVDEVGVGLAPGSAFGDGGDPYLRLCFGCSHELLQKGLDRLTGMFA